MNQLEQKLEQDFGIVFSQKDLLETAFTHTSYANEHRLLNISHNERLEFLGDAALQLVISVYLYKRYPNKPEGEMSKMRSTIVRYNLHTICVFNFTHFIFTQIKLITTYRYN